LQENKAVDTINNSIAILVLGFNIVGLFSTTYGKRVNLVAGCYKSLVVLLVVFH
jgi:hypothetical protein